MQGHSSGGVRSAKGSARRRGPLGGGLRSAEGSARRRAPLSGGVRSAAVKGFLAELDFH